MNIPLITEEQSEKLKQIGFDRFAYQEPLQLPDHDADWWPPVTVALAVQWLRSEKQLHVGILTYYPKDTLVGWVIPCVMALDKKEQVITPGYNPVYATYEMAQAAGLDICLLHLLEKANEATK